MDAIGRQSWLVFRLTGSSALLGLSSFASQIPVFPFATIGGTVADRSNRHRIIVLTQTASMIMPLTINAIASRKSKVRRQKSKVNF